MSSSTKAEKKKLELTRLIESSQFSSAYPLALGLSRKYPTDVDILYILAGLHAQQGKLEQVIQCCRRVTGINPNHAGAWYNLATALSQQGQFQQAAAACQRVVEINPASAEAFYRLGVYRQSCGEADEAITAYQNALHIKPDYVEALNNIGHIFNEQGHLHEALKCFSHQVRVAPDSCEGYNNLGVVYDSLCLYEEAEAAYLKAIGINPGLVETLCHLGFLLADQGRTPEAIDSFDQALKLDSSCSEAIAGKAVALEKLGQLGAANALVVPIVASTSSPDVVLAYCRVSAHRGNPETAVTHAERLLSTENLPPKGIVDLHYALGDLYDRMGDFPAAFRNYQKANDRSPCMYNHLEHRQYIDRIITSTSRELLDSLPRARSSSRKPIFIVGMPRSGTSLAEQILASHRDVFGAGELRYLGDLASSLYPEGLSTLTAREIDALAGRYMDSIDKIAGTSSIITDKLPHNFLYLGLIQLLFPEARIVHMMRNSLDNCLSLYFHGFNPMHSYTTDLTLLGAYYLEYQRLMEHWREVLDIPLLEIYYEDMVAELPQTTRKLLDFCGLDWSDDCLHFHASKRFVKTPSYDQVRRPIYTSSVDRWQHYNEFIEPLKAALGGNSKLS